MLIKIFHCARRKKLGEQEDEHKANLMKMAENAEAQLAQKDVQLAMLEAKLCKLQLQFEKTNWGGDLVSSDDQDEKVCLSSLFNIFRSLICS